MRLCGTDTNLQSFVVKCWEFAVHDMLGERLNWEGGKDKRVAFPGEMWPTRKRAVKNLLLKKVMISMSYPRRIEFILCN